jgi:TRAP transporter TAXI family solute receptor
MALNRRGFLTTLALAARAVGGAGALAGGVAGCGGGQPPRTLNIACGEPGGLYLEFGQLLAAEINTENPDLHATAIPTSGSEDNLARLAAGTADLALTLADSAQTSQTTHPHTPLSAIGRVYENYLQLVVPAPSPIHTVTDLAGHTISLGADGSGAALTGQRLLAVTGLHTNTGTPNTVTTTHYPLNQATTALRTHHIDALIWSGGVPTPALAQLANQQPIRLIPLAEHIPALRQRYHFTYEPVTIPADTYSPTSETTTIGVPNLLLCRPDTDPTLVTTTTRVLVTHAPQLVPQQALGTQFLDPRNLIATHNIPLHPAAANTYRTLHG